MQVVGYEPRYDGAATLLIAEERAVRREPLHGGRELAYALGERHCAGTLEGEEHVVCDAAEAPYCDRHTDRWPCARCTGNCSLPIDNCLEEHAIYLAAFAPDTFKVGVTKSRRLDRRLREQGADRGAHIRTVANGRIARQIEADIATDVGDRVRVPTKIRGLHREVDEEAWERLLAAFETVETYAFEYDLDLADRPQQETVLTGTVRATKGRVLLLHNAGSTYAVDLRDLIGYELRDGDVDRELQASLGAFD